MDQALVQALLERCTARWRVGVGANTEASLAFALNLEPRCGGSGRFWVDVAMLCALRERDSVGVAWKIMLWRDQIDQPVKKAHRLLRHPLRHAHVQDRFRAMPSGVSVKKEKLCHESSC
jgi:hypothetical protein